jgi:hypothetical protein
MCCKKKHVFPKEKKFQHLLKKKKSAQFCENRQFTGLYPVRPGFVRFDCILDPTTRSDRCPFGSTGPIFKTLL